MIEIYIIINSDNTAFGKLYVNDVYLADVLINHDKFGKFPYKLGVYYFIDLVKPFRYAIKDETNPVWSQRGFQIHTGNTLKDSEGCVLIGQTNDDWQTLYLSKKTFQKFEETCKKLKVNMLKFIEL